MSPTAGIPRADLPIPNEMTSVGPSCRKYLRFSREIVVRPTNATEIIAFEILSLSRVAATRCFTAAALSPGRRTVDDT
jgi:hypothetical protein